MRDIRHPPEFHRLEIRQFFQIYNALEPGKSVEAEWVGRAAAEAGIETSRRRLRESGT